MKDTKLVIYLSHIKIYQTLFYGAVKNLGVKCQKVFSGFEFLFYVFIRDITPLLIFINLLTLLGKVF